MKAIINENSTRLDLQSLTLDEIILHHNPNYFYCHLDCNWFVVAS